MLHMPTPMLLGGGPSLKTDGQFKTYIASLAVRTLGFNDKPNETQTGYALSNVTANPISTTGYGSSWLTRSTSISTGRLVQHAVASQAVYNSIRTTSDGQVLIKIQSMLETVAITATDRNGFATPGLTVADTEGPFSVIQIDEVWYYDAVLGPMRGFPYLGVLPAPVDWS